MKPTYLDAGKLAWYCFIADKYEKLTLCYLIMWVFCPGLRTSTAQIEHPFRRN
jgi:hypothetical protein